MNSCRRNAICLLWFGIFALAAYGQETPGRVEALKAELARTRDLKLTAHRMNISVDKLSDARTALREATDLAQRQDSPAAADFSALARLWATLDRKQARAQIASMIGRLCNEARSAKDLISYRSFTAAAFQLLFMLVEMDPEKAQQLADLWPEPASSFGEAGRQALGTLQGDLENRLAMSAASALDEKKLDQYLQPQTSVEAAFSPRISIVASLANANQKEKARQVLDRAVADIALRAPDPGKNREIESFLLQLSNMYPEKLMEAFENYKSLLARQDPAAAPGFIYELGEEKVLLDPVEAVTVSLVRSMYGKPELTMKLLESQPGLRAKFEKVGGMDAVISMPSSLASSTLTRRSYPANAPPPVQPAASGADPAAMAKAVNYPELLRKLRGKAETDPGAVRRMLIDTYQKKEHFQALINLAQMALYSDPDLSFIAMDVAHGLIPAFDTLQQKAASLRSLISAWRRIQGEVESTLLSEGYILAMQIREEEKEKAPAASELQAVTAVISPSDDLVTFLLAQNALDDFRAALSRVHALPNDFIRIKALIRIAQSFQGNYF